MKKILIFYGSYGGGHFSAARNIKEYIETNYSETEILLVDCVEYINKALNKVSTKTYAELSTNAQWLWKQLYESSQKERGAFSKISNTANKIMAKKLNKLIQEFNPNAIISTFPFSSQMCAILKKKHKITCKLATVLTDYAPHREWLIHNEFVDYFFVAHEGMKTNLMDFGVCESKIFITGIPLSNRFLLHYDKDKVLQEFGLAKNKKTILFFAGRRIWAWER